MIRNLKALGLAMAAMFALGAVGASAASAQAFGQLTSDGPVTLTGTELEPTVTGKNALTNPDGTKVECPHSTYTGHPVDEPTGFLASGATTVAITPHYNQEACTSYDEEGNPFSHTVFMNGCDYVAHVGEEATEHTYKASFDVVCPPGEAIEVISYSSSSHSVFNQVCKNTVGPQTGLEGGHVTHTTAGDDIDITGPVTGIHATKSGACNGFQTSTTNNIVLDINVTVTGHNEAGENTEVTVTDKV